MWSGSETISFGNNDADNGDGVENPFTFVVSGTVTAIPQEITVLDGATSIVSGQTTPINFGSAVHNATGPSKTFTIRNDGDQTLTLDHAVFEHGALHGGPTGPDQPGRRTIDHLHRHLDHRRGMVRFRDDIVRQ